MLTVDAAQNRLLLKMPEITDENILKELYGNLKSCISDLSPGFHVVLDMSGCNVIFIKGLPLFKSIMECFVSSKASEVVEIVNDGSVSSKQIRRIFSNIQCYKPVSVNSIQEAEQKLNIFTKRNGIRIKLNPPIVKYTTDEKHIYDGHIVDISISGCAIEADSKPLSEGDGVVLMITFDEEANLVSSFRITAQVVRSEGMRFAVQFANLGERLQEQLYERLVYELGRPCKSAELSPSHPLFSGAG